MGIVLRWILCRGNEEEKSSSDGLFYEKTPQYPIIPPNSTHPNSPNAIPTPNQNPLIHHHYPPTPLSFDDTSLQSQTNYDHFRHYLQFGQRKPKPPRFFSEKSGEERVKCFRRRMRPMRYQRSQCVWSLGYPVGKRHCRWSLSGLPPGRKHDVVRRAACRRTRRRCLWKPLGWVGEMRVRP